MLANPVRTDNRPPCAPLRSIIEWSSEPCGRRRKGDNDNSQCQQSTHGKKPPSKVINSSFIMRLGGHCQEGRSRKKPSVYPVKTGPECIKTYFWTSYECILRVSTWGFHSPTRIVRIFPGSETRERSLQQTGDGDLDLSFLQTAIGILQPRSFIGCGGDIVL